MFMLHTLMLNCRIIVGHAVVNIYSRKTFENFILIQRITLISLIKNGVVA